MRAEKLQKEEDKEKEATFEKLRETPIWF